MELQLIDYRMSLLRLCKMITWIFLVLAFLIYCLMVVRFSNKSETSQLPPGPWKLPVIGHLHHLLGLPHHALRDLAKKYGPLMYLQLGEVPAIIVSSSRVAEEVYKTHDIVFADRPALLAASIICYDYKCITFSPYGEYWKQMRKISVQELFSARKVQSMWSIREDEVSSLVDKISSVAGSPVNLTDCLMSLTNDITSRVIFGKKCKAKNEFLLLMEEILTSAGGFSFSDLFPSLKFLPWTNSTKQKLVKIQRKVDKILQNIIEEHRENRISLEYSKKSDYEEDFTDVLLRLQEDNNLASPIDDENIKANLVELFIGGSESSSTALVWALSELIRNPRLMEKAQAEVRNVFVGKKFIHQADINELKFLRLVIKETLRLHSPNPLLVPRESRKRCEISGHEIPEKTKVIVNAWAMGRDPEVWSNPDRFDPDRFKDLSIDYKGTNFEYIPFGAGRRICPGLSFAVANIELPLAQLLYHFNWKLPNGLKSEDLDMSEVFGATSHRKISLNLIPYCYRP